MFEELKMPALGIAMTEGVIVEWMLDEGEAFDEGEVLVRIETDKAQADLPAPFSGILVTHLVQEDAEVPVGEPIAIVRRG
jgi:2-oxoglutarate dehydrogenase E2 component (dihydrolipoamide succinyltransferase)